MMLKLAKIGRRFGQTWILKDLNLEVEAGECVALLGPSGCGKTTLLRCICGLEQLDSGTITLDGLDITNYDAEHRKIGLIFQKPVLYPHLDVAGNLK